MSTTFNPEIAALREKIEEHGKSDKNFSDRFEQLEKRIEQSDKNMAARFEDLKQEVRAQRK